MAIAVPANAKTLSPHQDIMKTLVITGASGFIGLNIVEHFLRQGWRVRALALDRIDPIALADFARLPGELETFIGDARDPERIEALMGSGPIDAVVAGAAITSGPKREGHAPSQIFEVNLVATLRLLESAQSRAVPRMVVFSSAAAMGELAFEGKVVTESDRPRPVSLYGTTKAALETLATRWPVVAGTPRVLVVRLAAALGPWERDTGLRDTLSVPLALVQCALSGEPIAPLPVAGARDYAYGPEVAAQIHWLLTAEAPAPQHNLYQLSSGFVWHPSIVAQALAQHGEPLTFKAGAREIAFHDDLTRRRSPMSADRISSEFRKPPPAQACADHYVRWALAHREWFAS